MGQSNTTRLGGQRDWKGILVRIAVVLGALLVLLVSLVLLYILLQIMLRVGDVLTLFILGAIIAYVVHPAVSWVSARVGKHWVGTVVVYFGAAVVLAVLALSLLQPLVSESASLIRAVRNPPPATVRAATRIVDRSHAAEVELRSQRLLAQAGAPVPHLRIGRIRAAIAGIEADLTALGATSVTGSNHHAMSARGMTPQPQVRVPPSYLDPVQRSTAALAADYQRAVYDPEAPDLALLTRSIADANSVHSDARALHATLATTPVLLLDAQTWVDEHNLRLNVVQSAGQVLRQISSQVSSILNNTAGILSQSATVLLDCFLILIISVYFVADGERMIQQAIAAVPDGHREQATFFVNSLHSVLGGYIRAQILLALLAGVLGGVGAAVLGVPYPLVIGASTFFLQLLPVIGPVLVYIVPVTIALIFTSMPTPLILLAYFIVLEQVVTNVIGPRVNSKSVGIHPLEAMAAALLAYPIFGILGSFLAVPIVGLIHVVVKEAYTSWRTPNRSAGASTASTASSQDEPPVLGSGTAGTGNATSDETAKDEALIGSGTSR